MLRNNYTYDGRKEHLPFTRATVSSVIVIQVLAYFLSTISLSELLKAVARWDRTSSIASALVWFKSYQVFVISTILGAAQRRSVAIWTADGPRREVRGETATVTQQYAL